MVDGNFLLIWGSLGEMARKTADKDAAGRKVLTTLLNPKDWADVAAAFDRSLRVFSDAVRPALRGLPASKLSHSNLLLLVMIAADDRVWLADLIRDANLIASNAGYALKALREAGYVEVEMDPANRRTRIVYATAEGKRIAGIIRQRCRVLSAGDELAEVTNAADRLESGLEAAAPAAQAAQNERHPGWSETVSTSMQKSGRPRKEPPTARSSAPIADQIPFAPAGNATPHQASAPPPAPASPTVETANSLFGPIPGRLPRRRTSG